MSSKEIGIDNARKVLGDLVTAVQQGAEITITRNGKPAARLVAHTPEDTMTTYTAALATESDCVAGDYCDIQVLENEIVGYREDPEGNEVPEYGMTSVTALDTIETDVRTDDSDKLTKAGNKADDILAASGWRRVEGWTVADNAMYALVERT